jgi:hypothetical protein
MIELQQQRLAGVLSNSVPILLGPLKFLLQLFDPILQFSDFESDCAEFAGVVVILLLSDI